MVQAERYQQYQGGDWFRLAFRPFRNAFVFSGRSTRTEVVAFFILGVLANMTTVVVVSDGALGLFFATLKAVWSTIWNFPWIALFMRRLHDQGRSGWWALLLSAQAVMGVTILSLLVFVPGALRTMERRGPFDFPIIIPWQPLAGAILAVYLVVVIVTLALFLWPAAIGPNRYGPDPRAPAEAEPTPGLP